MQTAVPAFSKDERFQRGGPRPPPSSQGEALASGDFPHKGISYRKVTPTRFSVFPLSTVSLRK